MTVRAVAALSLALAASIPVLPAVADEQAAIDGCIDRLRAVGGPDAAGGGEVLSHEWSQAGTLVMLRDAGGSVWRCIGYDDGSVGELAMSDSTDDGGGAMAGSSANISDAGSVAVGQTSTKNVKFAKGTTGATYGGRLEPGASMRFVLGARKNQFLYVTVDGQADGLSYQIFNPDGSFLLDMVQTATPYRGQLWQSGDHVVEVINRGNDAAGYQVSLGID